MVLGGLVFGRVWLFFWGICIQKMTFKAAEQTNSLDTSVTSSKIHLQIYTFLAKANPSNCQKPPFSPSRSTHLHFIQPFPFGKKKDSESNDVRGRRFRALKAAWPQENHGSSRKRLGLLGEGPGEGAELGHRKSLVSLVSIDTSQENQRFMYPKKMKLNVE